WQNGTLTAKGMQPLDLAQLAGKAHDMGLVVGAVVHGFNRWQWSEADFLINGNRQRLPLDGLALCFGNTPSTQTASGTMPGHVSGSPSSATHQDGAVVNSIDAGPDDTLGTRSITNGQYQVVP